MRVVISTEVVLDLLLDRQPESEEAARLFSQIEAGEVQGYVCDTSVALIYSVAARLVGANRARTEIKKLLVLCDVAPATRVVLEGALLGKVSDFEDAIVMEAANHVGADALVTRRPREFAKAEVAVYTPERFLKAISRRGRAHLDKWD